MILKEKLGYTNSKIIALVPTEKELTLLYLKLKKEGLIKESDEEYVNEIIQNCKKEEINVITCFDEVYPNKLRFISNKPVLLFYKGNIDLLSAPSISIVGTRKASEGSLNWTRNISKSLASKGYVIVSGGAKGIDRSAHEGALDANGKTICVIGSGIRDLYPQENVELIKRIMVEGLVISEYNPNTHVNKFGLLERNRITSGLGDKVLIISTEQAGGTISQYKTAKLQKKEIYCPDPTLKLEPISGIIELIKEKGVKVITNFEGLLISNQKTLSF